MRTDVRAYIYIYMQAHLHTHYHKQTHIRTYIIYIYTYTHSHTHIHTRIHSHTHTNTHSLIHTRPHARARTHARTHTHTHSQNIQIMPCKIGRGVRAVERRIADRGDDGSIPPATDSILGQFRSLHIAYVFRRKQYKPLVRSMLCLCKGNKRSHTWGEYVTCCGLIKWWVSPPPPLSLSLYGLIGSCSQQPQLLPFLYMYGMPSTGSHVNVHTHTQDYPINNIRRT